MCIKAQGRSDMARLREKWIWDENSALGNEKRSGKKKACKKLLKNA